MSESIFVIQNDSLIEMPHAKFEKEDDFAKLLAEIPGASPRKWILVGREVPIEVDDGGVNRLDHLFLDQDGTPTLVEVKRQNNPELSRKVVGQLLGYAADAVRVWSIDELRRRFADNCTGDPDETIAKLIDPENKLSDPESSVEDYWHRVEDRLEAGRIRLIFVADAIPPALRRIVEFLSNQMERCEVFALELRQYEPKCGELKAIVPQVFGFAKPLVVSSGPYYAGRLDYEGMIQKCAEEGSKIMVGFLRGIEKLRSTSLETLRHKMYKWDWADTPAPGPKVDRNWLKGDIFLNECRKKEEEERLHPPT